MKPDIGSLEYANARVQARHGQRVDELAWRRIEVMRGFAPALELARATSLRPWLVGITAESDAAQVEHTLRGHWQALVDELVSWLPPAWQGAMAWCAVLPDLAPLQHLARGAPPPPWMRGDEAWQPLLAARPADRKAAWAASRWAPLADASRGGLPGPLQLGAAWLAEWRRRLPAGALRAEAALPHLMRLLSEHAALFGHSATGQAWPLRNALRERLGLLLRGAALQPAVPFIHVALCALDMERLRAELLRRALFPRWQVA